MRRVLLQSAAGLMGATYRGNSASGAIVGTNHTSITVLAGVLAAPGDLMIVALSLQGNTVAPASFSPPSGWTQLDATNYSGLFVSAVFWKIAGAAESGSYAFSWTNATSGTASGSYGYAAYGGVSPATPIDASGGQTNTASTNYVAPSITLTHAHDTLIEVFATAGGFGGAPTYPTGMNVRLSATRAAGSLAIVDSSLVGAGATGPRTATGASLASRGFAIALVP